MLTVDAIRLKRLMRHCLKADLPLMVWGPTGVGKSQITAQIAAEDGYEYLSYMLLLRDAVDLRGIPMPDVATGECTWLRPDDLPFEGSTRFDPAKRYLLHMDEINTAPPSLMAVAFQLILERRAGPHRLMSSTRIIGCGNRQSDRAAAQKMPTPLENRFMHATLEAKVEAVAQHANRIGIADVLVAFLLYRPELLHKMSPTEPTHCSPRIWLDYVAKFLSLPAEERQDAVTAAVGEGPSAELEAFIRLRSSLDPVAYIIANPDKARTPDEVAKTTAERLGLRYAVAMALARAANRQNLAAILTYLGRLNRETAILTVTHAVRRDGQLMNTKPFVDWAVQNQDVTL